MTYSRANTLFDEMDTARKQRVVDLFESICRENTMSARDAFVAAVEDECKAAATESLLRQAKGEMQ